MLFEEKKTSVNVNPNDSVGEKKREEVVDKTSSSSSSWKNLRILAEGLKE